MRKFAVLFGCWVAGLAVAAHAESPAPSPSSFDPAFLQGVGAQEKIDIRRFDEGGQALPGRYRVSVWRNLQHVGQADVVFAEAGKGSVLCLNRPLWRLLDIDAGQMAEPVWQEGGEACRMMPQYLPAPAQAGLDVGRLRLDISLPQAWLVQRPHDYIAPERWQAGVNAAFVNYQINHYQTRNKDFQYSGVSLLLGTGANIGRWRLRHQGNMQWESGKNRYSAGLNYAQTDLPALRSQLTLGDFYSEGSLLESLPIRGVWLNSDERMLPASWQNYAPTIRGEASGNAQVTVRQQGRVIYTTTVSAGPFVLTDLPASGSGGDLEVTITEADGQERRFKVPAGQFARVLRPGTSRYQAAAGTIRHENNEKHSQAVAVADWQYGLTNRLTLQSGLMGSQSRQAGLLGAAVLLPFGNAAFNTTHQRTDAADGSQAQHAWRNRLQYQYTLPFTDTSVQVQWSRYSRRPFQAWMAGADDTAAPKQELYVSLLQNLGERRGSVYLSGSKQQSRLANERQYWQGGYNNRWRTVQYGVSFQYSRTEKQAAQKQWSASLSLPLDKLRPNLNLNAQAAHGDYGNSRQIGIGGSYGAAAQGYAAVSAQNTGKRTVLAANQTYRSQSAVWSAGASRGGDTIQWSAAVSGGVVLHRGGVTLSNDLGDSFAVVYAKDAVGAKVDGGGNTRIDRRGYAVVPYLTPYQVNSIGISPEGLPLSVSLDSTSKTVIPRAGSIQYADFTGQRGLPVLLSVRLADGSLPPLAAAVYNPQGGQIGFAGQGGRVFVRLANPDEPLYMDAENGQRCRIAYRLPSQLQPAEITHGTGVCETPDARQQGREA